MQNQFLIPGELLQGVVNYLATRPWREVAAAMTALEQLKPAQPAEAALEDSLTSISPSPSSEP